MIATMFAAAKLGNGIGGLDWGIIAAFLVVTTIVAFATKGRQAGIRDFFLGNRDLPWIAVCLSLMATEISAASFVGVPYTAFTGSLTYLQLAIGAILARILIGLYFIPTFYQTELYSPYQLIGNRLGVGAERMTRVLFVIGAVLGQAVRVFIVAMVLELITGFPAVWAIVVIGAFAALWAVVGGIRTVVWTDVLQLVVIVVAAVAGGIYVFGQTSGGFAEIMRVASSAGKTQLLDFRVEHALQFTLWTGLFGSTFNTLASHGADQMNTQRLFCCRSAADARKAVWWSSLSQVVVVILVFVGLGLYCYYQQNAEVFKEHSYVASEGNVLAIFVATVLPAGLKGLLVIGLLAAAISSLSSSLAALAQTTARSLYTGTNGSAANGAGQVGLARVFTLGWGLVLAAMALYFHSMVLELVVTSALKATSFTYGALLGALLLAFLPTGRDGRGLLFAAPIAVLAAFGMAMHDSWSHWMVIVGLILVFAGWCYVLLREADEMAGITDHNAYVRRGLYILLAEVPRTIWVLAGIALVLYVHYGEFYRVASEFESKEIAWPWYLPMGAGVTVLLGYLLSRPAGDTARAQ